MLFWNNKQNAECRDKINVIKGMNKEKEQRWFIFVIKVSDLVSRLKLHVVL